MGQFVDGVFGIRLAAFDARADPRGDEADAAMNVTAYGEPVFRHAYRQRADLSTARALESSQPGPMQHVVWLTVQPGEEAEFERTLRELARRDTGTSRYGVYERVTGGSLPGYLFIAQLTSWSDLDDAARDAARAVVRAAGATLTRAEDEIWVWRPDLTYSGRR
jgi:hypothetical protein